MTTYWRSGGGLVAAQTGAQDGAAIAQKNGCLNCHAVDTKKVGPLSRTPRPNSRASQTPRPWRRSRARRRMDKSSIGRRLTSINK